MEVRPLQVYYHSYLNHVNSAFTTKSSVSGTAKNLIKTPVYYRPSLSCQLAPTSLLKNTVDEPSLG